MSTTIDPKTLAEIYGVDERQIRRWRSKGAPLESLELMEHYLCAQHRKPAALMARLAEPKSRADIARKVAEAIDPEAAEEDDEALNVMNTAILDVAFGLCERLGPRIDRGEEIGTQEEQKLEIIARMKDDVKQLAALMRVKLRVPHRNPAVCG
jgi:hypothetical protein